MSSGLVVAGVLATIVLMGCARQAGPTPTSVPIQVSPSAEVYSSPEEALQQRAEVAVAAMSAGEWDVYYQYQSPRLRRRRWPYGLDLVQPCLLARFAVETDAAMARFHSRLGIDEDEQLVLAINRVIVTTTAARVYLDVFHAGELVDLDGEDEGSRWVLVDGEWWREDADLGRCPVLGFGQVEETDDG